MTKQYWHKVELGVIEAMTADEHGNPLFVIMIHNIVGGVFAVTLQDVPKKYPLKDWPDNGIFDRQRDAITACAKNFDLVKW